MTESKEEKRHAKLAELLAKNKSRLAREQLIHTYEHEFGYLPSYECFIDLAASHVIKRSAYKKMATLSGHRVANLREAITLLEDVRKGSKKDDEMEVLFYYLDTINTGSMLIPLRVCWSILERIGQNPRSDILIVEKQLVFGICFELEEYDDLLTWWGFHDNAEDEK